MFGNRHLVRHLLVPDLLPRTVPLIWQYNWIEHLLRIKVSEYITFLTYYGRKLLPEILLMLN
jgi:hypothetical protein